MSGWWQHSKVRKFLLLIGVNAILLTLLSEVLGLFVYYSNHGELFYRRQGEILFSLPAQKAQEAAADWKLMLHPFLGYLHRPGLPISVVADQQRLAPILAPSKVTPEWISIETNNYGFFSPHQFPYHPEPGEYVVGVFGGSVASWFSLQGAARLRNKISQIPELSGKKVTVLNFAEGGFKQPQQLQLLTYFLALGQHFDFVLNIDGFNEIALSDLNQRRGFHTAMPSVQHFIPILALLNGSNLDFDRLDLLHRLREVEEKVRRLEGWRSKNPSAALHLILKFLYDRAHAEYNGLLLALDRAMATSERTSLVEVPERDSPYRLEDSVKEAVDLWYRASQAMSELCQARGIHYLEVIQPNQYYSSRQFSEAEKAFAISGQNPFREVIPRGYRAMLEKNQTSTGLQGIRSGIDIFDRTSDPVYSDDCCHYNQRGNEILADFVAAAMVEILETNPPVQERQP